MQDEVNASTLSKVELQSIMGFYQAFSDHTPEVFDEVCAPDWQDIPLGPGQGPGPAGLKEVLSKVFLPAFPDLKIVVHEIVGSPGRAGVRAAITGTHLGEVMGVAPTGKTVTMALHEFHHLENGKLTHTWHLEDWFGMLNSIGAWPRLTSF